MTAVFSAIMLIWGGLFFAASVSVAALLLVARYAEKTRHRYSVMIQSSRERSNVNH